MFRGVLRVLGIVLLVIPLLPVPELFGPGRGMSAYVPPTEWLLGVAIFGFPAWLVARVAGEKLEDGIGRAAKRLNAPGGVAALFCGSTLALLLLAVSWFVFRHRPHLVDSVVQLFQAKIFAAGMVEAPRPPVPAFFATLHMIVDPTGWYSQYPPGHSALLVPGVLAGVPWVVPVALSLGTFVLLVGFARIVWDRATSLVVALLLLICPFFWFMGASFMNHVSTLFFVSACLYFFARWERDDAAGWAALAGLALGAASLSRPLTAVAVGAVFGVAALLRDRGRWKGVVAGAIGFGGLASIYLLFNAATTGDPLLPGYVELWGGAHGLGFHPTPWGEVHDPISGLRNELIDLSSLNVFLFEWPIPALWPLGIVLAAGWIEDGWSQRLVVALFALPAVYFFYWHRDAFLGPRYLYAGVAFIIPLTARAMVEGWDRLRGRFVGDRASLRPAAFGAALVCLCFLYSLAWGIPQRFVIYTTGMRSMKVDLTERAREAGLEGGLVFVATSWGNRILAELHGIGVSASVAERVYRRSDHCELQHLIDAALREEWSAERTERALSRIVVPRRRLTRTAELNGDPTLRLASGASLSRRCRDQIAYDRKGYTLYVPHLIENTPTLDGHWVVARDLRERNEELMRRYPDRRAYLYRGEGFRRVR